MTNEEKPAIDWAEVEAARRRSKVGRPRPDDQALCERAWRADPERYHALDQEVIEAVTIKMRRDGCA